MRTTISLWRCFAQANRITPAPAPPANLPLVTTLTAVTDRMPTQLCVGKHTIIPKVTEDHSHDLSLLYYLSDTNWYLDDESIGAKMWQEIDESIKHIKM